MAADLAVPAASKPGATTGPARHERWFGAMGTVGHVIVLGGSEADLLAAEDRVRRLEARWSRFVGSSEVSCLNAAGGDPVVVSAETIALVRRATEARYRCRGWFNPFLARELAAAGYDRDFELLAPAAAAAPGPAAPTTASAGGGPDTGPAPVLVDRRHDTVQLLGGVGFDPGGIGKGLAADMVSSWLVQERGVAGALVNVGGDLRAHGAVPPDGWSVGIDDPFDPTRPPVATVRLSSCAMCTSTPLKRRWKAPDGSEANHVIDPRTRRPAVIEVASVTVNAPDAWLAEALATAVMLAGPEVGTALLRSAQASALVVGLDGRLGRL